MTTQAELFEAHRYLVRPASLGFSRRYGIRCPFEQDCLFSAALWGLHLASIRFDPHRGSGFQTYARTRMNGDMLDHVDSLWGRGLARVATFESPSSLDRVQSDLPGPEERAQHKEALEDYHRFLPDREFEVLVMKFADGMMNIEIADRIGLSNPTIGVILARCYSILRSSLTAKPA